MLKFCVKQVWGVGYFLHFASADYKWLFFFKNFNLRRTCQLKLAVTISTA